MHCSPASLPPRSAAGEEAAGLGVRAKQQLRGGTPQRSGAPELELTDLVSTGEQEQAQVRQWVHMRVHCVHPRILLRLLLLFLALLLFSSRLLCPSLLTLGARYAGDDSAEGTG